MPSKTTSVQAYLRELPAERRAALEAVRQVILATVDEDIEEGMQYGMIGYHVPHRVFPAGYHCAPEQPLPYMALASQQQHMAVYLMFAYMGGGEGEQWIRQAYAAKGRRLDMGKSCLRFKRLEDLDLEILAAAIRRSPSGAYVATYTATLGDRARLTKTRAKTPAAKKPAAKTTSAKTTAADRGASRSSPATARRAPARKK